jgi:DNA-directed RNA polymerase subunit RPC12/RpoP
MMNYKCNKCGDEFCLTIQDRWSVYCFHCGEGVLVFKSLEYNEIKENDLTKLRKTTMDGKEQ